MQRLILLRKAEPDHLLIKPVPIKRRQRDGGDADLAGSTKTLIKGANNTGPDNPAQRNLRFGMAIGRGLSASEAAAEIGQVVEGAHTVKALVSMMSGKDIELPVTESVHAILYEGAALNDIIKKLLFRDPKAEHHWAEKE